MGKLGQLVCPLCGRFVSLAYFDPSGFDLDIYTVEVTGLGRGKGVKVVGQYSILQPGNITIGQIKERILVLSKLLLDNRCLRSEEVIKRLKIRTVEPMESRKLKSEVDSLKAEFGKTLEKLHLWMTHANTLQSTITKLQGEINVLEADLEDVERKRNKWRIKADELEIAVQNIRKKANMWKSETEALETMIETMNEKDEDYDEIYELIDSVEEALTTSASWVWDVDKDEYPIESLIERVNALINEYESLASEMEQYE